MAAAQAKEKFQAGDFAGAATLFEQAAAEVGPENLAALRTNIGACFVQMGQFADAVAQYKMAIERLLSWLAA